MLTQKSASLFPLDRKQLPLSAQHCLSQTSDRMGCFLYMWVTRRTNNWMWDLHCHPLPAPPCSHGCSAQFSSALCVLGEGSIATRWTARTVITTAACAPCWKGYLITDIPISLTWGWNYTSGSVFTAFCRTTQTDKLLQSIEVSLVFVSSGASRVDALPREEQYGWFQKGNRCETK